VRSWFYETHTLPAGTPQDGIGAASILGRHAARTQAASRFTTFGRISAPDGSHVLGPVSSRAGDSLTGLFRTFKTFFQTSRRGIARAGRRPKNPPPTLVIASAESPLLDTQKKMSEAIKGAQLWPSKISDAHYLSTIRDHLMKRLSIC
jgi:hypothetical protein